jgi:hypothetical protein
MILFVFAFLRGDDFVHIGCNQGGNGGLGVEFLSEDHGANVDDWL